MVCALGCATFRSGRLESIDSFPADGTERPAVAVAVLFEQYRNGERVDVESDVARAGIERKCVGRLRDSGLFSRVGPRVGVADLRLGLVLREFGESSRRRTALDLLTGFLLPSHATDTFELDAIATDLRSGRHTSIHLEETVTTWRHLFLLPLMPFALPPVVANRVRNDLFDRLAIEVLRAQDLSQ